MAKSVAATGEITMSEFSCFSRWAAIGSVVFLGACTVLPTGPSVMVLPGTGQPFERFRADDVDCRQYAQYQIGGKTAGDAAKESVVTSAAVGTAVGALAGAAIGGNSKGAAIGAGAGLLMGSATGTDASRASTAGTQRQYDNAYIQCMYAKGHRVPVPANMSYSAPVRSQAQAQQQDTSIPPPPPGSPPPPPASAR
ncbi:YMGG-like glycine zipper-containing protein [uncultured Dechloromonas sp.]|uniref:YMGG-like glycine zipper-containing protein n=1 Tax=uncultured Dechloromonas sp. TaxID=171719 RepID=UPI0025EDD3A9|nr:YMGG-like glycine zipper-containing protein [uncultured Dechloromonas sp.]